MTLKRILAAALACAALALPARASALPPIGHVFTIVLENNEMATTFSAGQVLWPYLARELPLEGAFVPNYFGTGHSSLDNYIAMISGQGNNPKTSGDCEDPSTMGDNGDFRVDADGQAIGIGCTYPAEIPSIATQLTDAGRTWKGYMQDMDASPATRRTTCRGPFHKNIPTGDPGSPKTPDDYRAKHNPFVYFHSVFDDLAYCDARDVPLTGFENDLKSIETTPNFSFIVPNQCDDAHDVPTCSDDSVGGLSRADDFLRRYVPIIEASPAFQKDGLLIVTFDEGLSSAMCCNEPYPPNMGSPNFATQVGGWGGGQTGAIFISRFVKPGTVSPVSYNHYSYLRSIEDLFGLAHLGYAARADVPTFGSDIYTN